MKRPLVVTILSIFTFLTGLLQVLIGIVVLADRDDEQFLERSTGIGMIIGSLILLYLLFGTEKAKRFFAR